MAGEMDVVLIYLEDQPLTFARIEEILADHKAGWYHVKLLLLQIPLQVVTWILRDAYINGDEFTMNGQRMRLENVVSPSDDGDSDAAYESRERETDPKGKGSVIDIRSLKKS